MDKAFDLTSIYTNCVTIRDQPKNGANHPPSSHDTTIPDGSVHNGVIHHTTQHIIKK